MSKIVDREISIPQNVKVTYEENSRKLSIEGSNGSFCFDIHQSINLVIESNLLKTFPIENYKKSKALAGTANSLIFNAVKGSNVDYLISLEIKGVGYRASSSNGKIVISAGYSHDVIIEIPDGIRIECANNSKITVKGSDKQKVGWFASKLRDVRKPNVFVKSLKGIFYETEIANFKVKPGKRDSKK